MKVIFLDVDGVLNSIGWLKKNNEKNMEILKSIQKT